MIQIKGHSNKALGVFTAVTFLLGSSAAYGLLSGRTYASAQMASFTDSKDVADGSKIKALQKQRLAVLREATDEIKSLYLAGGTSLDRLQAALRAQYHAELDLCENDKDRLRVWEEMLKLVVENEQALEKRYKAGNVPKSDFLAATASRLEVAISIEKLRAKLKNDQK